MKFKSVCFKLTLFYVLIVMFISLIFSFVLYGISYRELNFGLERQERVLRDLPRVETPPRPSPDFEKVRLEQLEASNRSLKIDLIYFNLIILILSGGLSYLLARRTLRPIEEMMEEQNRFTADASHELRTPLTAMKAEIEVNLRDKNFDFQSAKNLIKSNLEEINKLENLSNALLKLANYEENKNIVFEKFSLEDIITEAFERVEKLAKIKEIGFESNLKNIKVTGNKSSLIELFVILLDNAIKYSNKNSKVFIMINKFKNFARIEIKDQGIGIKASDLPHIFDRFYRSDISRSKVKTDGYGLGLAIAKKIVELHRGRIKVESEPDKGSTFTILLPIR